MHFFSHPQKTHFFHFFSFFHQNRQKFSLQIEFVFFSMHIERLITNLRCVIGVVDSINCDRMDPHLFSKLLQKLFNELNGFTILFLFKKISSKSITASFWTFLELTKNQKMPKIGFFAQKWWFWTPFFAVS